MKKCEVCGREYNGALEITAHGVSHTFDCFECAISSLAPKCAACGARIIDQGIEIEDSIYCSEECSEILEEKDMYSGMCREWDVTFRPRY